MPEHRKWPLWMYVAILVFVIAMACFSIFQFFIVRPAILATQKNLDQLILQMGKDTEDLDDAIGQLEDSTERLGETVDQFNNQFKPD